MAKTKISQYDSTASNNTDIDSINIDEGCAPSGINNAIRELMAHLKDFQAGLSGDTLPLASGGTNATTASGARTNLGLVIGTDVASTGANSDITSLTGLTTALSVAQGGTGATTLAGANIAVTNASSTFTASQRGTVTTDNDLSFDQNATNNFSCTPSAGGTLTFTNHTAGQSGYVLLDNSGGHAITAHANSKIHADDLTAISTAGVYLLSYFDNGTNAYITISKTFS
jgi:hypothetical protein